MTGCMICLGRGTVRLPIYREASAKAFDPRVDCLQPDSKEFPCPECSQIVTKENIAVVEVKTQIASVIADHHTDAVKKQAATILGVELLNRGMLQFERGPVDNRFGTFELRVALGVVTPGVVQSIEGRLVDRQERVARLMVEEGMKGVRVWRSYYGDQHIEKDRVETELRDALQKVVENLKGKPL